ncbi:hypothetical protein, partial [Mycobacterium tuberculosis]
ESFDKDVSQLNNNGDMSSSDETITNSITDVVTFHLNMLGELVKHWILIYKALWLSEKSVIGRECETPRSSRRAFNHLSSEVTAAMEGY